MVQCDFGVEHGAEVLAYPLTVRDADDLAVLGMIGVTRWSIDDDPKDPPDRLPPELNVEDLEPAVPHDATGNRPELT